MDLPLDVSMPPADVPLMVIEERVTVNGVRQLEGNNWLLEYTDDATPVMLVRHEVEPPPPPPEPVFRKAVSGTVYFRTDSVDIADVKKALEGVEPGGRYLVLGHADPRGSARYNEKLSLARANAVAEHLKSLGAEPAAVFGMGELEPKSGGKRQAFQYDRRVEIKPIAREGEILLEE